ncbi:uncharacterized protein LOC121987470 [Zingiber officinale]|uniref:Uncharacterized protein n=1 Tax=Zingiber officinale TaxID=94328 RepID=A0A8J5GD04_ZINOF|nr:uncharacterized protein LOC121987470 [Zingiber officinale]KAG6503446.1 hypothetical protein ZIOFF_035759 [Zingiber officinale]
MAFSGRLLLLRAMRKRRTWLCLFLLAYALLLYSSWTFLLFIHSWHHASTSSSASAGWLALCASLMYGSVFGLLAMGSALAVAVPATLVTWITILVLLAFAGKPRGALVMEGLGITAEIAAVAIKVLVREGSVVAGVCAGISFFALLLTSRRGVGGDREL